MEDDWERRAAMPAVSLDVARRLLGPHQVQVRAITPLEGGLVNGLYRVDTAQGPRALRIYLRDAASAVLEREIAGMLPDVPMPRPLVWGDTPYPWVLQTWCPGRRMSEVLPEADADTAFALGQSAARWLHGLRAITFEAPGWLGEGGSLTERWPDLAAMFDHFLHEILTAATPHLPAGLPERIVDHLAGVPGLHEGPVVLCHADYKPTNLLVQGDAVSALMDWEFSFAGSQWFDVGQLLRWADKVHPAFTRGVVAGLGPEVGDEALRVAAAWDLMNLLQQASLVAERPVMAADALERIHRTLEGRSSWAGPGELTDAQVSKALGVPVSIVDRQRSLPGIPMTSEVHRLILRGDGPPSVVAKLGRADAGEGTRAMYAREIRTYRTLAEHLPMPRGWHAGTEHHGCLLLLEDLTGVTPGHPLPGGMTEAQATHLLRAVARWHARPDASDWTVKTYPEPGGFQQRARGGWARLDRERFPATPEQARAVEAAIDQIPEALAILSSAPRVLSHGDLHAENLLFRDAEPVVLDWQNTARAPRGHDVAGALTTTAPAVLREAWERLVEGYLAEAGTDADALRREVRAALVYQCGAIAWLADHAATSARDITTMQGHWERLRTALQVVAAP